MHPVKELLERKIDLEERIYNHLSKAIIQIDNKNYLTLTKNLPKAELVKLRSSLLELNEDGANIEFKMEIANVRFKNYNGNYEQAELEKPIKIDVHLSRDNFQVDRHIRWTDKNGIVKETILNNIRVTIFVGPYEKRTIIKIEI